MTTDPCSERSVSNTPLRRFLRGESDAAEVTTLVRRLLIASREIGTPRPGAALVSPAVVDETQPLTGSSVVPQAVETALAVTEERWQARELVPRFRQADPETRRAMIEGNPKLATWGFVTALLSNSSDAGEEEPAQAVDLAREAVKLAEELDPARYGTERVEDLRACAYARLGNAIRVQDGFREAEQAFARAEEHLLRGTGDPLQRARIDLLRAGLLGTQQQFDKAIRLLDRVIRTARRYGERHLEGKALITQGFRQISADRSVEAIVLLHKGLRRIDPEREPRLVLVAWHNLTLTLTYQGRYLEALDKLPYIRELHEKYGSRIDRLRLRWVEARIDLGRLEEAKAERTLRRLRSEFIEADMAFDAALVSLDLASLYARQGRSEEMRQLAREMIPIFQSREVHQHALAAILVLQQAAEMERVTSRLLEEIVDYVRRARNNPNLKFRSHSGG